MHLEEFAEGDSLLHRLDPRVKFITLMPFILLVAILKGIELPLIGLMVSLFLVIIARLPLNKLMNRLLVVNTFVLLLWLFIPFSYPGREIISIGPLSLSHEGLVYVLSITIKTNAIVLATIAILGTSEIFSLAHALLHLKMPEKLVYLFFFFYRYISVLHEEYTRLKRAMAIRCFHPKTNMHTYRSVAYLVGMLLVKSYERSQRIYQAMLCRGFQGRFPLVRHFRLTGMDILFLTVMTSITITMAIMGIT